MEENKGRSNVGAIAGGVIGGIVGVSLLLMLKFYSLRFFFDLSVGTFGLVRCFINQKQKEEKHTFYRALFYWYKLLLFNL